MAGDRAPPGRGKHGAQAGRIRAGARGRNLVAVSGLDEEHPSGLSHEINVYAGRGQAIIIEILMRRWQRAAETLQVQSFADIASAMAWLEGYTPPIDLTPEAALPDEVLADIIRQGLMLRLQRARIEARFRAQVAEMVARLVPPAALPQIWPEPVTLLEATD